jgi:hypothetical protein
MADVLDGSKIVVTLQIGHEIFQFAKVITLNDLLEENGPFESLNFPGPETTEWEEKLYCTPVTIREIVEKKRNLLAKNITEKILDMLSKDDKICGYEWREVNEKDSYR